MKFTHEIAAILKSYVYVYFDPRNKLPFYIGKGCGNRAFDHLCEQAKSKKVSKKVLRIKEIKKAGLEPQIEILRYGLSDGEATIVEAAVIDLMRPELTNAHRGEHSGGFGRISAQELAIMLKARPTKIEHKAILIRINKLYSSNMSADELYEATRGIWKIGPKRNQAEFAMAVYQGIVREVYQIKKWHPAGTLRYQTRDSSNFSGSGRWEFDGTVTPNIKIRGQYIGRSVRSYLAPASRNPIKYAGFN